MSSHMNKIEDDSEKNVRSSKTASSKKKDKQIVKKRKSSKTEFVFPKLKTSIFVFICLVLGMGFFFAETIERFVNFSLFQSNISTEISDDGLKVHFLDVGQADAIVIEFPNGKHMLVDAGESATTVDMSNYFSSTVFTNGEDEVFDYFLLTHSDSDHAGGAKYIFQNYVVNTTIRPQIYTEQEQADQNLENVAIHNTVTYQNFVSYANSELDENGIASQVLYSEVNLEINEGEVNLLFLGPIQTYYGASSYNELSPIVLIEYKEKRILLTGDATIENESEVLDALGAYCYDVDVFKLGHHGSNTSTSDEFLKGFKPEVAIISVGAKSTYGHPSDIVLERLNDNGISDENIYSTFTNGTIVVGIYENESNIAVVGVSSGYSAEKPWISWWQFSLTCAVISFGFLFSKEIKFVNKKLKSAKH